MRSSTSNVRLCPFKAQAASGQRLQRPSVRTLAGTGGCRSPRRAASKSVCLMARNNSAETDGRPSVFKPAAGISCGLIYGRERPNDHV